ncbi:hypothetical protein AB0J72_19320 [Dactylosporangium sp. NPDC049742]|uniref:hypothetical protein n=1 Tax=Dactylosporangium sp. NPDC049742 TaxID=3154737 RepID=UPI00341DC051
MMTSTEQPTPVWATPVNNTPVPDMTAPAHQGQAPAAVIEGPPAQRPAVRSSRLKTAIVGAVAALVIGGGGFAVIRASGDSAAPASQQAGAQSGQGAQGAQGAQDGQGAQGAQGGAPDGGQGGRGAMGGGMGRGAGGLAGVMYGDFVAADSNGGYITRRMQTGTVTAVSATSITAKSADGHATTFAVTSATTVSGGGTIGDVQVGDTVTVVGTVTGDTASATAITATVPAGN